jgi:hypothetical protein
MMRVRSRFTTDVPPRNGSGESIRSNVIDECEQASGRGVFDVAS